MAGNEIQPLGPDYIEHTLTLQALGCAYDGALIVLPQDIGPGCEIPQRRPFKQFEAGFNQDCPSNTRRRQRHT